MGAMGAMAHAGAMADPFTVRTLCELPMLIGLLLVFGLAAFAAALVPARLELPSPLWTALRVGSVAVLLIAPLQLLTGVAAMAGTGLAEGLTLAPEVVHQTNFGHVWLISIPLLLVLTAIAWQRGRSRSRAALIALIGASLLALRGLVSHAIDFGAGAVVVYIVHECAAGLWGGALLGLLFTARRGAIEPIQEQLLVRRESRLAGWCVAALVASGIYIAYCALGLNLDHLLYSAYGRMLIAKVSVFAILLALGGYNRYWLVPGFALASARNDLFRSVRVECLLMTGVVALAVLLANTPPSH
jgi:putative copper export protein